MPRIGDQKVLGYDTISPLIISKNFFDKDIVQVMSLFNELNPTSDQLADLSYSRQKLFYSTFHEILKNYQGEDKLINNYLSATLDDKETEYQLFSFSDIHSEKYTKSEFKVIQDLENILPSLLGYRFYTLLKLGMNSLYKEENSVKYQPLIFHHSELWEIMNRRKIKSINTQNIDSFYSDNEFRDHIKSILSCVLVFGHLNFFEVEGIGNEIIYSKAGSAFISRLIDGVYIAPTFQTRYFAQYGFLNAQFLKKFFNDQFSDDIIIQKNIIGKTAIMKGFAELLKILMSPEFIETAGNDLGIEAFAENPEVWSQKNFIYAFYEIFDRLIKPETRIGSTNNPRDPTDVLLQIFTGNKEVGVHRIATNNLRGVTSTFWRNSNYGSIAIDYPTLVQFFGTNFHKIQPALFYTRTNLLKHPQPLSVEKLLTPEFKEKIKHIYNNLYKIISENYDDGQDITAIFHKDSSIGLHRYSTLREVLPFATEQKFNDLFGKTGTSLTFKIEKKEGKISNPNEFNRFITSITFYIIAFNSIVLIKEGKKGTFSNYNYGFFASQNQLFGNEYITGLGANALSDRLALSPIGVNIYNTWRDSWNLKDGRTVWNYEDCWPIHLFDDARALIDWFIDKYNLGQNGIDKLI